MNWKSYKVAIVINVTVDSWSWDGPRRHVVSREASRGGVACLFYLTAKKKKNLTGETRAHVDSP